VTAIAVARPYDGRAVGAVAPATTAVLRRAVGTLHEPNAWTAGILLTLGVAVIARHPIARALGTEVDTPVVTSPVATAPARPASVPAPAVAAAPVVAVPMHAPRNPFAALISTTGEALAPQPAVASKTPPAPPSFVDRSQAATSRVPTSPTPSPTSCSGQIHRVVAGDTLWSLAARAVRSTDSSRVTIAWHRLYDVNRAAVGSNPSLLQVGSAVCLPSTL
jgi:nucleoid-associated protein YgaU